MLNEFLERLFQRSKDKNSRSEVKRRLKLILAHDRADLSPAIVESMQQEILEVISRYVELDTEGLSFALESDRHTTALTANFPILRIKDDTQEDSPAQLESQDDQTTQEEDLRVAAIENLEIVVEENEDADVSATTKNPE
jgi:cell division topological specificity factor